MNKFWEIYEQTGTPVELASWTGGLSPGGGPVVYAETQSKASDLYQQYRAGARYLKRDISVDGYRWRNIIAALETQPTAKFGGVCDG